MDVNLVSFSNSAFSHFWWWHVHECIHMCSLQWVECHREGDGRWTAKCWASYGCVSVTFCSSFHLFVASRLVILCFTVLFSFNEEMSVMNFILWNRWKRLWQSFTLGNVVCKKIMMKGSTKLLVLLHLVGVVMLKTVCLSRTDTRLQSL